MASENRLDLVAWDLRSTDFGSVREYDDGRQIVAMEYAPAGQSALEEWLRLRELWLDLAPHPHLLDALDRCDDGKLLLRYAALDWNHPPIRLHVNRRAREMVAEWGVQLTNTFLTILDEVPTSEAARFLRPVVKIDLGRAARVGFLPIVPGDVTNRGSVPPEALETRLASDERSFVYVIGKALGGFCAGLDSEEAVTLKRIIDRCVQPNPTERYGTLDDLRTAWRNVGGNGAVRTGESLASWTLTEEALGWLALGRPTRAVDMFEDALELDRHSRVAQIGLRRAFEALGIVCGSVSYPIELEEARRAWAAGAIPKVLITWSRAEETGHALEAERAFNEALAQYLRVVTDGTNDGSVYTAIARCYLALGSAAHAVDYAQRALAIQSKQIEAHSIRARGYLLAHKYEDALKCAGVWVAADRDDANAHYICGRALLKLGQLLEARDAFDRALGLKPEMLEAMLLRREADRAARQVREDVGTQPPMEIDLPDHLLGFRDALMSGRVQEVITILERPEYDTDVVAKLVQARCLAFEKRFDEAVATYDGVASVSSEHRREVALGKADALLALDRAEEALTVFEQVGLETPGDLEAIEGQALALRQLGRNAEAEHALGKVVAASGGRSELRIGSVRR